MAQLRAKVALVIPAYNEEAVIGAVVTDLRKQFAASDFEAQIVVVDDGSSDETAQRAEKAGATVIRHILNIGSGGATATGLSYANAHGFEIAATLDADGQHRAADVLKGIDNLLKSQGDLLIGSRIIDDHNMSWLKKVGNRGLSTITYILFGINVTDSQSGLRVFSERALRELKWKSSGYEFCSEMLWRAKQLNLSIGEFPIKTIYTKYSTSKPGRQTNWNGFNIVKVLLRQRIVELFSE